MRRIAVELSPVLLGLLLAVSCSSPVAPGSSAPLDKFVDALRQQGLSVNLAGEIPPEVNRFFSVPAHQVRVNNSQVNAFVYPSVQRAQADASLISPEGQPNPNAQITWVSTPRFYRQDALIVLYVGCATEITQALQLTVGGPIAVGPTPCGVGR